MTLWAIAVKIQSASVSEMLIRGGAQSIWMLHSSTTWQFNMWKRRRKRRCEEALNRNDSEGVSLPMLHLWGSVWWALIYWLDLWSSVCASACVHFNVRLCEFKQKKKKKKKKIKLRRKANTNDDDREEEEEEESGHTWKTWLCVNLEVRQQFGACVCVDCNWWLERRRRGFIVGEEKKSSPPPADHHHRCQPAAWSSYS